VDSSDQPPFLPGGGRRALTWPHSFLNKKTSRTTCFLFSSLSNSIPQFPIRRRRSHRSTATACSARIRRKRCEPRLLRRVARSSARAPAPPRACSPRDAASHGEADLGRRELFGGPSARIGRRPAAGWPPMTPRREADGWI
jgi:hypothetical protein